MSLLEDCASAAAFDAHLASSDAVVCHYWASWCEPCGAMDELMRELAASHLKDVRARIADLKRMERVLADSVRACDAGRDPGCPLLDTLGAEVRVA